MATERDTVDAISSVVTAWERKAKASMHLDGLLHPIIKAQLVQALATEVQRLVATEVATASRDAKSRAKMQPAANT